MEHIRQFDWCALQPNNTTFVTEQGLDNCVTEKLLRNKFCNPLLSSDSEDEGEGKGGQKFDWNQIFKKRHNDQKYDRIFVPGLRPPPASTRMSSLTAQQHHQLLKVLCSQNPRILPDEFLPRPTKLDLKVFEDLKETYEKEQKEYIAWAKSLWSNGQCVRALRPAPVVEAVYEAEFRVRAQQMKGFPAVLEVVAQLPLDAQGKFEMEMLEELIGVKPSDLPVATCPDNIRGRRSVLRPCPVPEPCDQHPVRLLLPHENSISVLPIIEVHRELAQYAARHDCQFIASEGALRCLLQRRAWTIPVSVFHVPMSDGGSTNVIVLGSEFCNKQENAVTRTFRAYRHLLEFAFVPSSEMSKRALAQESPRAAPPAPAPAPAQPDDSDDDDDNLFIDYGTSPFETMNVTSSSKRRGLDEPEPNPVAKDSEDECSIHSDADPDHEKETEESSKKEAEQSILDKSIEGFGVYHCTCQDSMFEHPPSRSFRKWQFRNRSTIESYNVIVHSAHKHRGPSGEILLEPIPEYQADLGASKQSEDRISSLALSLALRDNASVLNVRIDAQSGDVITTEQSSLEQFLSQHGQRRAALAGVIHSVCNQLQGLVPGQYVLQHEPSYGDNVLLYAPRNTGEEQQLRLKFDKSQPAEADEAKNVKNVSELTPALLPWHKFRKILPCAFTHYPNQIVKPKKPVQRQKTPPRALKDGEGAPKKKWPKKRGRKP